MISPADLRTVPLFVELGDDDLERLAGGATLIRLDAGDELFAEGDPGHVAYVIVDGEIEILKRGGRREVRLAMRRPGEVIGEMALLQGTARSATARASVPSELIAIPRAEIDDLLATSAEAARSFFRVLLERWKATQSMLAQNERMAQLGTLTAGLAHELNNPAAAVTRSAGQLREAIARLLAARSALSHPELVDSLQERMTNRAAAERLDAITRSDLEAEAEDRLAEAGVSDAWHGASMLVEMGLADSVDDILADPDNDLSAVMAALVAHHDMASLLHEVEEGTRRLSQIVTALKSYSYLDQDTTQSVDVTAGLDDTLLILRSKLEGIKVVTEYDPNLPRIEARGGELNQVWTNLIDNAAYSITQSGVGSTITIRAYPQDSDAVVEIEDDGPGFAQENVAKAFDAFFTTKPPGSGTGLGLSISYGIIVDSHHGEITLDSRSGRTVFRIVLPPTISD